MWRWYFKTIASLFLLILLLSLDSSAKLLWLLLFLLICNSETEAHERWLTPNPSWWRSSGVVWTRLREKMIHFMAKKCRNKKGKKLLQAKRRWVCSYCCWLASTIGCIIRPWAAVATQNERTDLTTYREDGQVTWKWYWLEMMECGLQDCSMVVV